MVNRTMFNRRQFLQSSIAAASGLAAANLAFAASPRSLGVQLYTVRKEAERDLPSVLEAIRKIGYQQVETYWNIYNHPAAELRRMIADHGLTAPSGHFNYGGLESKLDYAKALGVDFVICPMLPKNHWHTLDDFKRAADQFNLWGEKVHRLGMQFGFHNHNYEFHRFGDTTGFDTLMTRCDAKLVCLEMDCYWITQAGEDPLKIFERFGSRIQLLHLKDRKPAFAPTQVMDRAAEHFTEVGSGTIAWKPILDAANKYGATRLFVERDSGDHPAIESLRISYQNLQAIG
jgi:sugar phosphate isomerase/epimerase